MLLRAQGRFTGARHRAAGAALGALAACLLLAAPAAAFVQRVPTSFFGVNGQGVLPLAKPSTSDPAALEAHLNGIQSTGASWVRGGINWSNVESNAPYFGYHSFSWTGYDPWVTALARHGLRWHVTLGSPPVWAQDSTLLAVCADRARQMLPPKKNTDFGAFAAAVAKRYGPNGSFWSQHPELPYRPVQEYEVWNEENDKAYFCPKPDPAKYARMYVAARDAIHATDPAARVMVGGLAPNRYVVAPPDAHSGDLRVSDFLRGMVNAEPGLAAKLDAVGVHSYRRDPVDVLADLAWYRRTLERAGLGSAPLEVTETGWPTHGPDPSDDVPEERRVVNYRQLTNAVARTDCNLAGFAPFTWVTDELNTADEEDWYGIAGSDGHLYPSAQAYGAQIKLFLGQGLAPAPRTTQRVCGLALPDTDHDGTPDQLDDFPLDPLRKSGSSEHNPADDPAPQTRFRPARTTANFFGITGIESVRALASENQHVHYAAMHDAGIGDVRGIVRWSDVEPLSPSSAYHEYQWTELDRAVRRAAIHEMRWRPAFRGAPTWALSAGSGTQARAQFAAFLAAFAARYGRGGAFWDENRGIPQLPVTDYEIWYRGNVSAQWVDGSAAAAEYADFYMAASAALHGVDPQAIATLSLSSGGVMADDDFLRAMVDARPALSGAVHAAHLVTAQTAEDGIEAELARLRSTLASTGNPAAPITLEVSFAQAGPGAMTDLQRRDAYVTLLDRMARSDCGIAGVFPRGWASAEASTASSEGWIGIARPADGSLYLAGQGYAQEAKLFEGLSGEQAPYGTVHMCSAPAPDSDGDGTPDEADDFPYDAGLVSGSDADGDGVFNQLDPDFVPGTDTVAPVVTIDSGPASTTANRTPTLTFSSEPGARFECRFDTEPSFTNCSGGSYSPAVPLPDGPHTLWVRGADAAGNVSSPASRGFTVDTTGPGAAFDSGPISTVAVNDPTPTFTFSGLELNVTFACSIDGSLFLPCLSPFTTPVLSDGYHTIAVRAIDLLGNGGIAATRTFLLDLTAPIAHIDSGPKGTITSTSTSLAFSATGKPVRFECRLDGGGYGQCVSPKQLTGLADGAHSFRVRAADAAGNVSSPVTRSFAVDASGPGAPTITSGPAGGDGGTTTATGADFSFQGESGGTFECSLDSGSFASCSSPRHYSALPLGAHTFSVRQKDKLGRTGPAATYAWTVVATPDTRIDSGPSGATADSTPEITFSSTLAGATFECALDAEPYAACASPQHLGPLGEGVHTFVVRAVSATGQRDPTPASRSFTVDTSAPVAQINSGPSGPTADATPTFGFSGSAGATFECRFATDPGWGGCSGAGTHTPATPLADGANSFSVRARDAAGNTGDAVSQGFSVDTTGPGVSFSAGPTTDAPTNDTTPTFAFAASDADARLECRLDGAAFAVCSSPLTTARLAEGAHTLSVRAIDLLGNVGAVVKRPFLIDVTAPLAHIDSGPSGTITTTTASFAFSAVGKPTRFECSLDAGGFANCQSPSQLTDLVSGSHTFSVRAADAAGNVGPAVSRSFKVDAAAPGAPTITAGPAGGTLKLTNSDSADLYWTGELGGSYQCSLDGSAYARCASPWRVLTVGEGRHVFAVRQLDVNGDHGPAASYTWTVDLTAPETKITHPRRHRISDRTPTIRLSSESGARFSCRVDKRDWRGCRSSSTLPRLKLGEHVIRVRATDQAGNLEAEPARLRLTIVRR